jgi:hypothetical protein
LFLAAPYCGAHLFVMGVHYDIQAFKYLFHFRSVPICLQSNPMNPTSDTKFVTR